jgi:hypothetical protein
VFDPKIREDIFPFVCENPECEEKYDLEGFKAVLNLWGLVYADCGNFVYQGITCPKCKQTSLKPAPRDNPLVDLRDFIIAPNPNPAANTWEQFIQRERAQDDHEFLKFKCIPAWEDETIGYVDIIKRYPSDSYSLYTTPGVPYLMMIPGDVERKQQSENESGEIQLRRLYPDVPRFRNLLICLSPGKLSRLEFLDQELTPQWSETDSPKEIREKKAAWIELTKKTAGDALRETVRRTLEAQGFSAPDAPSFEQALERNLWLFDYDPAADLSRRSEKVGFEATIWQYLEEVARPVVNPLSTEIALDQERDTALGWTKEFEKGKALFIDAPVGLGRAYAIAEGLAQESHLSAVIFMPTDRDCREMVTRLKISIAEKQGLRYGQFFAYEEGPAQTGLKRDLLEKEVYYVDPINVTECPSYDRHVEGYARNWTFDQEICDNCEKREYCRFISHAERAPLSRIIVAAHGAYGSFCRQPAMTKWLKGGSDREEARDLFVVNGDLLFSACYKPSVLDDQELEVLSEKVTAFLSHHEEGKGPLRKVWSLFEQIRQYGETVITPPMDADFTFPQSVKEAWKASLAHLHLALPEILHPLGKVGEYLDWIEHAVRLGLLVEPDSEPRIRVYLPNPAAFDLYRLPPHVFFDAPFRAERFVEKKLRNVACDLTAAPVKLPWRQRVIQNVNGHLLSKGRCQNQEKVEQFVGELLKELGDDHTYLFITSKAVREEYLHAFLQEEFYELNPLILQYGGLTGTEDFGDCNVAVVLGTHVSSEAVEIAGTLEWIRQSLPENELVGTQSKVWTWKENGETRIYKDDFRVVGELAEAIRFSEQRKALASTRYLFHDVDFYVLSREPISDLDPFLPEPETDQYRADIFPPKSRRRDSKYQQVREAAYDWLKDHPAATVTAIHRKTGIRRGTVAEHLKQLEQDRELVREGKKYKLPA